KKANFYRKDKGFSLTEVVAAIMILFFGVLVVLELFPRGIGFLKKTRNNINCLFLAQKKIEEILYYSDTYSFSSISGNFEEPYLNYSYNINRSPYGVFGVDADYDKIEIKISGPLNTEADFVALALKYDDSGDEDDYSGGIGLDSLNEKIFWIINRRNKVWYYDVKNKFFIKNSPSGLGIPAGITSNSNGTLVWLGDKNPNRLWYFDGKNWIDRTPSGMGEPTWLSSSSDAKLLWISDQLNDKVWYYDGNKLINKKSKLWYFDGKNWTDRTPSGMGEPAGIASSADAKIVWIADQSNNKVWYYDGKELIDKTPGKSFKVPSSIACNSTGEDVWVIDNTLKKIWIYDGSSDKWSTMNLPKKK
ncbi:MAG: hypothetical protein HYU63_00390, partial [Armatimonadetes bacterium]|nr:hypothetical protein [Armatimonadota bacterium]